MFTSSTLCVFDYSTAVKTVFQTKEGGASFVIGNLVNMNRNAVWANSSIWAANASGVDV